uniref:Protein spire homolog 1 n=1 Tax=Hadrurus spadix TaxID=141984 RepID=A0A1W7R9I6_9SCOR
MAVEGKLSPRCALDEKGCVKLSSILEAFNAPISEEQAWAVCYQTSKCILKEWELEKKCYCIMDTSDIRIHKDGSVHPSTIREINSGTRILADTEYQLVSSLGVAIFKALDYGLSETEERSLSTHLETLIDLMTSSEQDDGGDDDDLESQNGDEGIERDSEEDDMTDIGKNDRGFTLLKVIEICANHLACPDQGDVHYKAVCRALVAEVLELSSFLEKISTGTKELREHTQVETEGECSLDNLQFHDWAGLWMQVIRELRQGVKLRKVDREPNPQPIEYELTPYEMLLDDIRSRRYKLNKIMVNGDLPPRVKKDAHALILEFIRSRPPLVPVSKRKLPPAPPKQPTLYEKLMASIRQQHTLRPTGNKQETVETSRTKLDDDDDTPQPRRRLIKADLSLCLSPSFDDEDVDDLPSPDFEQAKCSTPIQENSKPPDTLALQAHLPERRHSISVCESPSKPNNMIVPTTNSFNSYITASDERPSPVQISPNQSIGVWSSSHWEKSIQSLSLTLEEVVHIRNVLTKAELETLMNGKGNTLYEELAKGKVCFTCKKTRFSFFGSWGVKCKLCERTVCDKCSTRMHIPTDHFSNIPVYMLSPTPSPVSEEPDTTPASYSIWRLPESFHISGLWSSKRSQESSPKCSETPTKSLRQSRSSHTIRDEIGTWPSTKKSSFNRSRTIQESEASPLDIPKGPLMTVCRECKGMVRHIILTSRGSSTCGSQRRRKWAEKRALTACVPTCMTPLLESPSSNSEAFNFNGQAISRS